MRRLTFLTSTPLRVCVRAGLKPKPCPIIAKDRVNSTIAAIATAQPAPLTAGGVYQQHLNSDPRSTVANPTKNDPKRADEADVLFREAQGWPDDYPTSKRGKRIFFRQQNEQQVTDELHNFVHVSLGSFG